MADTHLWLLHKRGLYYRPNDCGYTGIKDHAARYTEAEACARMTGSGIGRIREDAAPEFSEACFEDRARDHLRKQRDDAQAEIARLRAENENHAQRIDAMHAIWRTHKCNVDGRRSVGECVDGEMCGCSCALFIPREPVTNG